MPAFSIQDVQVLISEQQIAGRMSSLAKEIQVFAQGKEVLLVPLLRGSFMFAADLMRELSKVGIHPQIDFVTLSSYGAGTQSSGQIVLQSGLTEDIANKYVIIVDDILESGRTLAYARRLIRQLGALDVRTCVLLEKPGKRAEGIDLKADYVGFEVPDRFVVGYGLDYGNRFRELPFIGTVEGL